MSVQAISWALSVDASSPGTKFVLVCLANYADANGICWPSQSLIAKQTQQSVDTVQRRLKELVAIGLISRNRRQNTDTVGGRASDYYRLNLTPQIAAKGPETDKTDRPYTANQGTLNRTVAASNEPRLTPKGKKDRNPLNGKKRGKPRHGQTTKDRKRIWLDRNTTEFNDYAKDFTDKHRASPLTQWDNTGAWFNIAGEFPPQ